MDDGASKRFIQSSKNNYPDCLHKPHQGAMAHEPLLRTEIDLHSPFDSCGLQLSCKVYCWLLIITSVNNLFEAIYGCSLYARCLLHNKSAQARVKVSPGNQLSQGFSTSTWGARGHPGHSSVSQRIQDRQRQKSL